MRAFNFSGSTKTAEIENQKILKVKMDYYVFYKNYYKRKLEDMAHWGRNRCTSLQRDNLYIKCLLIH